jgi:hypothetical protein
VFPPPRQALPTHPVWISGDHRIRLRRPKLEKRDTIHGAAGGALDLGQCEGPLGRAHMHTLQHKLKR